MQGRVHAIAHHLLDQVQSRGEMDLIDEYAFPLPIMVIVELLGIPPRDHGRFRKLVLRSGQAAFRPGRSQGTLRSAGSFEKQLRDKGLLET
ncbi:MAG: hypothetical protein VCF24_29305 [Candidatus Latescibacterota bacterium]|jgi:cytochrome P450